MFQKMKQMRTKCIAGTVYLVLFWKFCKTMK